MEKYMSVDNISSYYEQVVQKKVNTGAVAKITIVIMLILTFIGISTVLALTVAGWILPVALISLGLGIYIIVRMIKSSGIEYEYTFVTGELRIARIKGKAKRRNITYFDCKNIDDMGHYIDPKTGRKTIATNKYRILLRAAADPFAFDTYYFSIHDKVRREPAILLMTPNEKLLGMIKPYLSVELKKKLIKLQQEDALLKASVSKDNDAREETEPETDAPEAAETKSPAPEKSEVKKDAPSSSNQNKNGSSKKKER